MYLHLSIIDSLLINKHYKLGMVLGSTVGKMKIRVLLSQAYNLFWVSDI